MTGITSGFLMTFGSNLLIQVTVVLLAGWALETWANRHGAAWKCLVQRATLASVLAIPLAAVLGHTLMPTTWYVALPEPVWFSDDSGVSAAGWIYIAFSVVWFGGAAVLWARLLGGLLVSERLRRRSVLADDALAARVRALLPECIGTYPEVRLSNEIKSPLLLGIRRPALLLPTDDAAACDEPVLLHELTHLHRRDNAWLLLAQAVRATLWLHPLVWLLDRRRRETAEFVCDDAVINRTADPTGYARALLRFAEHARPAWVPMPASSLFGSRHQLRQRVRRMLSHPADGHAPRYSRRGVILTALWMGLALLVSTLIAVHHAVSTAAAGYAWLWCAAS